jgi:ABC-type glycerol-3-phosphate transport system substrate-binding protein
LWGADVPDIVMLPQPGRLFELEKEGKIVDLKTFMDDDYLQQQYPEAYLELATLDGKMLGVWFSVGLKSLVWYPSQAFKAKGYEVPETWDELMALSDQIVADGGTPWCIAINDFDGLRWVGTDWVEDILLRTAPPETYDAWVRHDLPFNSPEIRRVFEIMGQIWLNEDYVYGGVRILHPSIIKIIPPTCLRIHRDVICINRLHLPPSFFRPVSATEKIMISSICRQSTPSLANPCLAVGISLRC